MHDVIVVGAGPSGCFLGGKLASKGLDVKILEEHAEIGRPMCCAGILGKEGMKEVGLDPEEWSLNELRGGVFHFPSGDSVRLTRNRTEAFIIDRAKFDQDLAEGALREGAEIELNTRCTGVSSDETGVSLRAKKGGKEKQFESRMVVGADGTNSLVARNFGLIEDFSPTICAQAEIVGFGEDHEAHVYLSNDLSRDFFAWIVSTGEAYRVGLGDRRGNVVKKLLKFIKNKTVLPPNAKNKIVQLTTGLIPNPGAQKIHGDRVLLVGDAAGHVKPLTGGGLYLGLSNAEIAADIIVEALEDEPSEKNLQKYEREVNKKFGREFELGSRARRILQKMSDEDLSEFLNLLKKPKIRDLILENADFDHHSTLFKALMEEGPRLIQSIGPQKLMKYSKWFLSS